ncbi:unnamed protein product [Heligmosomoides polygyrus]|uniref:Reverse transcriptase domain-containing protein n=1 Tax=Heligmosomoides polygyrus TaxID=6339 RepID=A0A183F7J8_HELPZ|nr:unnamed protein product [Heligmosomoides polygyrus]
MDAITRDLQKPVPWTLLYADDVMLASEDKDELEREVQACCDRLERFGLRLNGKKTEYLTTDFTESSFIKVNGIELPRTSVLKYPGSVVASDGKLMVEVNSRSKIYRAVVWPVAMYDAECWPTTKEVETRLSVMLRWTAVVTRTDDSRQDARSSLTMAFLYLPVHKTPVIERPLGHAGAHASVAQRALDDRLLQQVHWHNTRLLMPGARKPKHVVAHDPMYLKCVAPTSTVRLISMGIVLFTPQECPSPVRSGSSCFAAIYQVFFRYSARCQHLGFHRTVRKRDGKDRAMGKLYC